MRSGSNDYIDQPRRDRPRYGRYSISRSKGAAWEKERKGRRRKLDWGSSGEPRGDLAGKEREFTLKLALPRA